VWRAEGGANDEEQQGGAEGSEDEAEQLGGEIIHNVFFFSANARSSGYSLRRIHKILAGEWVMPRA
jgi:hypothetical protein